MYVLMIDTHIPMFRGALNEMSVDRMGLFQWCKFYNSYVFSKDKKERPDEFTWDYDILMDKWIEDKEHREKVKTSNVSSNRSANNMSEVYTL